MDEPFAQHVGVKAMGQRDRCHGHAGSHASRDDQSLEVRVVPAPASAAIKSIP